MDYRLVFRTFRYHAEDGHRLWLRMERNAIPADVRLAEGMGRTAILDIASRELKDFWKGEGRVLLCVSKGGATRDGFTIRKKGQDMELSSASDRGVLYAAYDLLRRQQTGDLLSDGAVVAEMPSYDIRILNHWDNPDGTVETRLCRAFAMEVGRTCLLNGFSHRYEAYARANASIGINAASDSTTSMPSPQMLIRLECLQ